MRDWIEKQIEWASIGAYDRTQLTYSLDRVVLHRESGVLCLYLTANFILPFTDVETMRAQLLRDIDGLRDVEVHCAYADICLRPEDIVRLYVPYMVQQMPETSLSHAVRADSASLQDDAVIIYAIGKFAVEELNRREKAPFAFQLANRFGLHVNVEFRNHEVLYEEAGRYDQAAGDDAQSVPADAGGAGRRTSAAAGDAREISAAPATSASLDIPAGGERGTILPFDQAAQKLSSAANPARNTSSTAANHAQKALTPAGKAGGRPGRRGRRRDNALPAEGNRIMGQGPLGPADVPLGDIRPELGTVTVEGLLFRKDQRVIRNGNRLVTLLLTDDKTTTVCCKSFVPESKWREIDTLLQPGDTLKIRGEVQFDTYEQLNIIKMQDIEKTERPPGREDNCQLGKRVELHAHTKMSAMDGLNDVTDMVRQAALWGQPAVAITDHGVVHAFPDAANAAAKMTKAGMPIRILYGMEGYVFDDRDCLQPDGQIEYKKKPTYHIILLARTQTGLQNIYRLVSLSHLQYFYRRPRLPWSVLEAYRDGILIGSACEAGEVYRAVLHDLPEEELLSIAGRYDYLEIQPLINNRFMIEGGQVNGEEALRDINRRIVALADRLGKPVVATTDAHYQDPSAAIYRNILMAGQGYKDAEKGQGLYLRTTDEMLQEFSYLGEETARRVVIENTNAIMDLCDPDILPVPKGKFPPRIPGAEETLQRTCLQRAHELYGDPLPEAIDKRLEKELSSIIGNGYAVMYVAAQMLVQKSMEDGYLVGSRGSVGSSLVATMAGITEVNPLDPHYVCPQCKYLEWGDKSLYDCGVDMPEKVCPRCGTPLRRDGHTIPFETFLGFDGDKEPDIDLNFAGEYQATAQRYVGTIFGEENVFKAGTVSAVADLTAYGYVMKFFEETGRPINKYEVDRLTQHCTGVKRTTGQHPGGIVVVPDDHEIYEFCPIQHPANDVNSDIIITHFDYHKIDQNLLKLDILGHNVPSMIRQLQDMTGVDPLSVDLADRKVLSIFNSIEALHIVDPAHYRFVHGTYGIPEFGTGFVRQMLDDIKPDTFADLVRISGFSHGTDVWKNNAQDYIREGVASPREVIATRDDIMHYLLHMGVPSKDSFQIMEDVRKNRPLKEAQIEMMKAHDVPDWYIESCIKIQYVFPRAHAAAYTMMSFRMAWYKVYYPLEFYATHFTSAVANFDADVILKGPESVLRQMDAIQAKGNGASPKERDDIPVLEVAYEMYSRGYDFAPARLGKSDAMRFWVDEGKVLLPFVAVTGVGETAARNLAAAYAEKEFETVEDAVHRARLNRMAMEGLRAHGVLDGLPETDQLSIFGMM